MAEYIPTIWKDEIKDANGNEVVKGTPLSASNLNKLENRMVENDKKTTGFETQLAHIVINVKSFGAKGDGVTNDSNAVQQAINSASNQRAKIYFPYTPNGYLLNSSIKVNFSNIVFDFNLNKIKVTSARSWVFSVYPPSLESIVDGTSRPVGFENGIDGDFRSLMYESDDSKRIKNVHFINVNWEDGSGGTLGGRMVNFYSCDNCSVTKSNLKSHSSSVEIFMCRDFKLQDNVLDNQIYCFFSFKSKDVEVKGNKFLNAIEGCGIKGAYPQSGKTIYQGFDLNFQYDSNILVTDNTFDKVDLGVQGGYFNNSSSDISSGVAIGVSLRDWYGEVWGLSVENNKFKARTTVGVYNHAFRNNINGKFQTFKDNDIKGMSVLLISAKHINIENNRFYKDKTPANIAGGTISLTGTSQSGESENTEYCSITNNEIIESLSVAIHLGGANYCNIIGNKIHKPGNQGIIVNANSIQTLTKCMGNNISKNTFYSIAVDWVFCIWLVVGKADKHIVSDNIAYGGYYSGNANYFANSSAVEYKRTIVRVDTPNSNVEVGSNFTKNNIGDANVTTAVTGYAQEMGVEGNMSSSFLNPFRIGKYSLWVDGTDKLRIKATKPTNDTDGTIVGA